MRQRRRAQQERTLTPYQQKLRDPRWQKKRLEILERDEWTCQCCHATDKTLAVHHRIYVRGAEPWEVPDTALETLCEECHTAESAERYSAELFLLETLQRVGVPWCGLGWLADEIQRCFQPLTTRAALFLIKDITEFLQQTSTSMGLDHHEALWDEPKPEHGTPTEPEVR